MRVLAYSLFILVVLTGLAAVAYAQPQYYMTIPGITGESNEPGHQGSIGVTGMQTRALRGRSTPGEIVITKPVDTASPKLMQACANGTHIPDVVITSRKADVRSRQPYMTIKMSDVVITSYSITREGDGPAVERLQLRFQRLERTDNTIGGLQTAPATGDTQQSPPAPPEGVRVR